MWQTRAQAYSRRTALTSPPVSRWVREWGLALNSRSGCAGTVNASSDRMRVVATTPILADLAQQIAGKRASVHLVPPALTRTRMSRACAISAMPPMPAVPDERSSAGAA